ncbi:hypothetical protein EST38_g12314 [Candolleomyces aberdarensis]|uniref:Ribonuclease H1 N-terminal domain-containing protein n=1 Tax=Candolleomyces aberdarensis TaxID=2316362 RepID=A0A4Q2D2R3_9AGAR|nr:hypothetical protein EST38_g12314 [Candolleomyces aberdarensis]
MSSSNTSSSSSKQPASGNTAKGQVTLTQLIDALRINGINIVTPMEQIVRSEADEQAAREPEPAPSVELVETSTLSPPTSSPDGERTADIIRIERAISRRVAAATPQGGTASTQALLDATMAAFQEMGIDPYAPADDSTRTVVPPADDSTITGFVCARCNAHNLVRPAKDTWYVVTVGNEVGVFKGWHKVQALVSGVSGACYKKYRSEAEAVVAFENALDAGVVRQV